MDISPGSTKYWLTTCDPTFKPFVGQQFDTLEDGIQFYKRYGSITGFDVRRSSDKKNDHGAVVKKHVVCSRAGYKQTKNTTQITPGAAKQKKRKRPSNRVGCIAKVIFKQKTNYKFVVVTFEERHTHCLCNESAKPFLKVNRKLDIGHQQFIANCAKANIGPAKTFNLYAEMVGGVDNVGATSTDFKNYKRELLAFIKGRDAHMVVASYLEKKEACPDLYFAYAVDGEDKLCRVFWADAAARSSYSTFGDVVTFDATYQTNRYKMVFVPFTGVDNHKKSVTFAGGLIAKEDVDFYTWLLRHFKEAMTHDPRCIITDQDPAMKAAIAQEFPTTHHRYCMWHIMTKVGERVGIELAKNEAFRRHLNSVVWNEQSTPHEFETGWKTVIEKYGLQDNRWLNLMYTQRASWIPAYFQDIFMGGLLRTTSRSESENNVFRRCTNPHSCLVEFFYQFEGAIARQRNKQAELNAACTGHLPALKTPLSIERQAAHTYTLTIFYEVQEEIMEGCFNCRIHTRTENEQTKTYVVDDGDGQTHNVQLDKENDIVTCTCRKYARVGLLCRHIFIIFKDAHIDHIPAQYITHRWTRDATIIPTSATAHEQPNPNATSQESQVINQFYRCLGLANGDPDKLEQLAHALDETEQTLVLEEGTGIDERAKRTVMESYCGIAQPATIEVHPPTVSKNKGSGKRLKSSREVATKQALKA